MSSAFFCITTFVTAATSNAADRRPPPRIPSLQFFPYVHGPLAARNHSFRCCASASGGNSPAFLVLAAHRQSTEVLKNLMHGSSDFDSCSSENQGIGGKHRNIEANSSNELLQRLKRYGVSGILSYGLLNTAYYLTTFLVVWFYVAPAPGRMGYLAAVERFLKVMAMVWAGSQVTKIMRIGGALALAPFVDGGLTLFTVKFGFQSQGKAFMVIAGLCFGLAFLLFLVVTLLWA